MSKSPPQHGVAILYAIAIAAIALDALTFCVTFPVGAALRVVVHSLVALLRHVALPLAVVGSAAWRFRDPILARLDAVAGAFSAVGGGVVKGVDVVFSGVDAVADRVPGGFAVKRGTGAVALVGGTAGRRAKVVGGVGGGLKSIFRGLTSGSAKGAAAGLRTRAKSDPRRRPGAPRHDPPMAAAAATENRAQRFDQLDFIKSLIEDGEANRFDTIRAAVEDVVGGYYRGVIPMAGVFAEGRALPVKSSRTPVKTLSQKLLPGWYDADETHLFSGRYRVRGTIFSRIEDDAQQAWVAGGPWCRSAS
ncbi:hypothetical protein JL720_6664 [Aureococcus anophagefferens]|nr:hypothetical protein JL720_6664 [Aureococcus anophagefferens]